MIKQRKVIHQTSILHCDFCGVMQEFLGGFSNEEVRRVAALKEKWFRDGEYDVCSWCHKQGLKMAVATVTNPDGTSYGVTKKEAKDRADYLSGIDE